MVKIIYFDYHGVLDRRQLAGLQQAILSNTTAANTDTYETLQAHLYAYTTGSIQPQDFWRTIAKTFGRGAAKAGQKYFLHVDPIRENWDLTNELQGKVALGLFSDCPPDKKVAIRTAYNLPEFFDQLIFSSDQGKGKRDVDFYRLMLQDGHYQPGECLVVDAEPWVTDFAKSLGLATVQYQNPGQLREEISSALVFTA